MAQLASASYCGAYLCDGFSYSGSYVGYAYYPSTYYPHPGHVSPYHTMNGPYLGHVYISRAARDYTYATGYGAYSGLPVYGYASDSLMEWRDRVH